MAVEIKQIEQTKKCSVEIIMDFRLEHVYKFNIILWKLLTEIKWMTHNL